MRLYIRKDIISQLWDYGSGIPTEDLIADPYEGKQVDHNADITFGSQGVEPGQFQNPRDIAVAPDGSLYIADTMNHRIQHLAADGTVLQVWGSFADLARGEAPNGTFYEPWGVAVGPDGTVYVSDTWNHRIQRFSAEGEFLSQWGFFGQGETPFALWGPRDIAIDSQGQVFVSDTGNKRVVVYDADGNYLTQVQIMAADGTGGYIPFLNWDVVAWYGQSLDNKPYVAVDTEGNLYISDPEGYRILHFTRTGTFVDYFGDYGNSLGTFNLPTGLAVDAQGGLWVVDSGNNRVMHFPLAP